MLSAKKQCIRVLCGFLLIGCWFGISHATVDPVDPAVNHILTRSDVMVFVADGDNTGGTEYSTTEDMVETSGQDENFLEAQIYTQRYRDPSTHEEELRVFFSVQDIDDNNGDQIEFYFDQSHNHGGFGDTEIDEDKLIRVERTNCSSPTCNFNLIQRDVTDAFSGVGSALPIANAEVQAIVPNAYPTVGFQVGWTGEFVLTPSDLGWSYFPQVMGFYVIVRSGGQNAISNANPLPSSPPGPEVSYPGAANVDAFVTEADNWGNFKMRYPIDYALVLDYSGSMLATDGLADNRWVRAKRAADLFVATLGLFKDNLGMFEDGISISQYSWSCSGTDVSGDTTGAVNGVSSSTVDIPDPPTGTDSFSAGNSDNPAGGNCTPIRRGIEYALSDQLDISNPIAKKDQIVILLSDGFHNMPAMHNPFDPDVDFSSNEKEFTQVRTVALGPDGSAGTDLLAEISTAFNGGVAYSYVAKYNQVNTFADLLQSYLETVQDPLTINQVLMVGLDYQPGAPDKLVFIGVWDTATDASALTLSRDGSPVPAGEIESYVNTGIGYAAAVIDAPQSGSNWRITGASGGIDPTTEFVLADLRILARFLVEQKRYQAGDSMLLQVNLKDNGQPLLGADVTVEVAKPGEGLGNYLSMVQKDCSIGDPVIPRNDLKDSSHIKLANIPTASSAATNPAGGDPIPGRYGLAANHFERCDKSGLDRVELPGIQLYDDGSHGDLVANDGLYSLAFADTNLEGSYTFRFNIRGNTTDGIPYSRTRILSQFVGIEPDADATDVAIQAGSIINGIQSQLIYFLPKDPLGNMKGPGFAHNFTASTSSGHLAGPIQDLNNGYYLLVVSYPEKGSIPVVTIKDEKHCFEKIVDVGNPAPEDKANDLGFWIWLLLVIIVILLLLLFICFYRCRRYR